MGASPDVDRNDISELETFSFGQTNAAEYLDSLGHNPAYWCRWLRSGRWALTRVLKGKPDDKGRSTLLFVTALLDPSQWVEALGADATPLLRCDQLWAWGGESVLSPVKLTVVAPDRPVPGDAQRARVLSMLALVEARHAKPDETIVTSEHHFSPDDVRLLAMLLPHTSKESFSYAVRSLSEGLPVTINCLAGNASHGASARRIIRWSRGASYDPPVYTSAIAFFWKPGSPPPWEFVANCRAFGEAARQIRKAETPLAGSIGDTVSARKGAPSSKPKRSWLNRYVVLAGALLILVGATGYFVVQALQERKAEDDARAFLKANSRSEFPLRDSKERKDLISQGQSILKRLKTTLDVPLEGVDQTSPRGDLNAWLDFARDMDRRQCDIEEVLRAFETFANDVRLSELTAASPYPSNATRDRVKKLKEELRGQKGTYTRIGRTELQDALDRLDEWEQTCHEIILNCEEELQRLRDYYKQEPPSVLQNGLLKKFDSMGKSLAALQTRIPDDPEEAEGDQTTSLRKELQTVQSRADKWTDAIDKLRAGFNAEDERVEHLIGEHELDLSLPDARHLKQPWEGAKWARRRCESALRIWSDHKECKDRCHRIEEWREKASLAAYKYFRQLVDDADEAIRKWEGRPNEKAGEPAVARRWIREAMEYYDQMRGAIEQHDKNNEYIKKATELKSLLIPVQDKEPPEDESNPP